MLLLLDQAFALGLNKQELWDLASNLGSDVPFFLLPLAQIARGRGEILVPIQGLPRLHCVVIAPSVGLSTPAVYGRSRVPDQPQSLEPLMAALRVGATNLNGLLWNSLEPAARELSSEIDRLAATVKLTAPLGQLMSGSGSSCFALYGSARAAAHAARYLAGLSLGRVFQVNTI
jgi:4-diphosphocytidyl-2-C-methyl-D-erythritol kinase